MVLQATKEACNGSYTSVTTSQPECYENLKLLEHVREFLILFRASYFIKDFRNIEQC